MIDWLVLTASLPAAPSRLRVRIWRALKATGCATLRDGVYIVPAAATTAANDLRSIASAIAEAGADAHLLEIRACDAAQEKTFRSLFDRSEQYAEFAQALKDARKSLQSTSGEPELRRTLRSLEQQLATIRAADYFPGPTGVSAAAGLEKLRAEVEQRLSPGEPTPGARATERLSRRSFQGRTWATRKRPWVDRLATAWLIARFVDEAPRFVWIDPPSKCPKTALGFDFDGARFSHLGDKVTFEVVMHSFALEDDPALRRLGELVHYIDVGGIPVDEAAGIETLIRGLQAEHADDDALRIAAHGLFDTLYAAFRLAA